MEQKEYVRWLRVNRPAASGMALLSLIGGTLLAGAFTLLGGTGTAPAPTGPGPCVPGSCPRSYPEPHHGPLSGRDNGVNVFVGGDYAVRAAAAGAEGRVVVLGDVDVAKAAGAPPDYNVGVLATGSRVVPDDGSPFLRAGGDVKVAAGQRLVAQEGPVAGTVAYAGRVHTGTVAPKTVRDAGAVAAYGAVRDRLTAASTCYAYDRGRPRRTTGSAVNRGGTTVLTGDGSSAPQVFDVPFDIAAPGGGPQEVSFRNVPPGVTVLVNLTNPSGRTRTLSTAGSVTGVRREKLLWNFPDAQEVRLDGSGRLDGSVLIGRRTSTVRVSVPAVNGRLFTAGSLVHESRAGTSGQTLYAYPFEGTLPECAAAPTAGPEDSGEPLPLPVPSGPRPPDPAGLAGPQQHPAAPAAEAPRARRTPARSGPPMSPALALGTALVATGAVLALAVLYRTRVDR
ncbi:MULTISPECIES: choice-of-anchor A family protein [Streptomyces]|uniref:Choice-of-anchor A domain-containing protein n=1 Tax=Streptomyces luteosporeus TaxID=173856 RepID=A0ABN3TQC4_9ACTN